MSKAKTKTVPQLTDEREATIQAAIAHDPDGREASDEQLAKMRPASEMLSPALLTSLKRGRPKAAETKQAVKLRIDPKAIAAFRSTGSGWQTRMNDVLVIVAAAIEKVEIESVATSKPNRVIVRPTGMKRAAIIADRERRFEALKKNIADLAAKGRGGKRPVREKAS